MSGQTHQSLISDFLGKEIGNIKVIEYIGEGSMGLVFKGHHSNLDLDVAVKIIKDELLVRKPEEYLTRFEREARIAAKLNHRCITRIIDYGLLDQRPYIVIEYVDGFTLSDFVKAHEKPINEANVLKLIGMTASALSEAHTNNIIHRDLKPQNIMLSRQGRPYITDLGLARHIGDMTVTQSSIIMGSPAYMAPECFSADAAVDLRSDIYSLGCIAYFVAFKKLPVKGKSMRDVVTNHISGKIDFTLPTACSDMTIKIIKKMMAKNVKDRYQSAQDIVEDVKRTIEQKRREEKIRLQQQSMYSSQEYYTETEEGEDRPEFSSINSLNNGDNFIRAEDVLRILEQRLGPAISSHGSTRILHSTLKERIVLWSLLVSLVASAIIGYIYAGH